MKKQLMIKVLVAVVMAIVVATSAQAWNPGTHIYTAERVFPFCFDKIDLYYGSIAPDLALYVPENLQTKWPQAFDNTHYDFIDLRKDAWGFVQLAFAKGWLSHSESKGADYYAHVCPPNQGCTELQDGYVYGKARDLLKILYAAEQCITCDGGPPYSDLELELAHSAIEIAVDVLLKQNKDPKLAKKLLEAALLRSWRDLALLNKVLVSEGEATDSLTLVSAEITFRNVVFQYAMALSSSTVEDMGPMAELGAQMTGGVLTPQQVLGILELAIDLCEDDYNQKIQEMIRILKSDLR